MPTGRIKEAGIKRFGYITPDLATEDIYFHQSDTTFTESEFVARTIINTPVAYDVRETPRGQRAINVRRLEG